MESNTEQRRRCRTKGRLRARVETAAVKKQADEFATEIEFRSSLATIFIGYKAICVRKKYH